MEKYSVLMSIYRKEKAEYLKLAIESILKQTFPPDEIVIVKDGNLTDELDEVLNFYSLKCRQLFKIVGYEKNIGLGLALNYGLQYCSNDLVARMDSDDISKSERCKKQVEKFTKDGDLSIVGSAVDEFCDDVQHVISRRVVPKKHEEIYEFAKRRSAFNHPTVMFRKSKVLQFGGYSDLRRNQDVDLFGRMLFGGCKAFNFEESLLWFRSDDNLSKRRKSWENTWSYVDTIRRFWKMGYASFLDFFIVFIAQTTMFILPIGFQKMIYKKLLRG